MSSTPPRILVTGSRNWDDQDTIRGALQNAWARLGSHPHTVLVHGDCHLGGADQIAAAIWSQWRMPDEPHPAQWGPGGRLLGPERNQRMVETGADICLAFPLPGSRGTRNCMRLARQAGIPVETFRPNIERPPHTTRS